MKYDPLPTARQDRAPVLLLQGESDQQRLESADRTYG
jgi:hypothetical protein